MDSWSHSSSAAPEKPLHATPPSPPPPTVHHNHPDPPTHPLLHLNEWPCPILCPHHSQNNFQLAFHTLKRSLTCAPT